MSRQERSQATRDRLLEQGLSSFIVKGFHGTGIKEVLEEVGVPKGSFYNYFESKDDFGAQVIELYSRRFHGLLDEVIQADGDPLDNLKAYLASEVERLDRDGTGCLLGNLSAEVGATNATLRAALARGMAGSRHRFARIISEAQRRGRIRTDVTAEQLAGILLATWQGALIRMQTEASVEPLEECCELLLGPLFGSA
ncbi:MAG: TetR family transcriptional regulator C-terminal domain-containing protein [Gemmatimonadetes bacterium]|nr:TetR family transcriptional regulator C-terminal domain-containing protein [Gemmatimonadota bacterium]